MNKTPPASVCSTGFGREFSSSPNRLLTVRREGHWTSGAYDAGAVQGGWPVQTDTNGTLSARAMARIGAYTRAVTQVVRSAEPKAGPPPAPPRQPPVRQATPARVIETCIEDEFEGWEGETIFQLCNGQIWQQSEYAYTYHYAYRPEVVIYSTSSGYRMKVEGVADTIGVVKLR